MKYRIVITWKKEAIVEAEDREDAINQVLHNGQQPKRTDIRAWKAEHPANQTKGAMERYAKWFALKKTKTLREIAELEKLSISTIAKGITRYETHLINLNLAA